MALMYRSVVVVEPTLEPVGLAEAKLHLRVDIDDDDATIAALVRASREYAEMYMGRALVTQTRELVLDGIPGRVVALPFPPLQSVASVTFIDEAGDELVIPATDYVVDTTLTPGALMLRRGASWPAVDLIETGGVRIRYVAGYGEPEAVPEVMKAAIKLYLGTLYENREDVLVAQGVTVMNLPFGSEALLQPYRVNWAF